MTDLLRDGRPEGPYERIGAAAEAQAVTQGRRVSKRKPRRALVLFFEEGEDITATEIRERLAEQQYAIVPRPAVMRAPEPRHLFGIIAMPDDALEDDKRKRRALEGEGDG